MSLDVALRNSVSGLNVQQKSLSIVSQNIARSQEENFDRLHGEIQFDGFGGAKVGGIFRQVDYLLERELRNQGTSTSYYNNLFQLLDRMQKLFGNPDLHYDSNPNESPTNLAVAVDNFFTAVNMLSTIPDSYSQKDYVVSRAEDLCYMVSKIAVGLQELRLKADQEIYDSVHIINNYLKEFAMVNSEIAIARHSDETYANLEMQRAKALNHLSEYIPISTFSKEDGRLFLATSNGIIISDEDSYEFDYKALPSVESLIANEEFKPIKIFSNNDSKGQEIVSGGCSNNIYTKLNSGKIKALLDVRDREIPVIFEKLNNFAHVFSTEINELYTAGSPYPGVKEFTSKTVVHCDDKLNFTGNIRLTLLDSNGKSAKYCDNQYIKSLKVNLNGLSTVSELVNKINHYYKSDGRRVEVGDLYDVQISSMLLDNGIFTFDIDADNRVNASQKLNIDNVELLYEQKNTSELIEVPDSLITDLNYHEWFLEPNERTSSYLPISVNLQKLPKDIQEFTVKIHMRVNDDNYVIDYKINRNVIEKSKRFSGYSVSGGDSRVIVGEEETQYVKASFVDQDNRKLLSHDKNMPSFLKIESVEDSFYLSIDAMDSNEIGYNKRNFVHSMDFNNLFHETKEINNSAIKLAVNDNVIRNTDSLSTGRLSETYSNIFELGTGSNEIVIEMASLAHKNIMFSGVGSSPSTNNSFVGYVAEMIEYSSFRFHSAKIQSDRETKFKELIETDYQSISGVNTEEEIVKSIVIRNAYNASAQIISTVQELFRIFMEAI